MAGKLTQEQQEHIAYLAISKHIPRRTVSGARQALSPGQSLRVQATAVLDGTIQRGYDSEQSADSGPLKAALLGLLLRDIPDETIRKYRKMSLKVAHEVDRQGKAVTTANVNTHIAKRDPRHAELMSALDADAASELPQKTKTGDIRMVETESWIESVKVEAAD